MAATCGVTGTRLVTLNDSFPNATYQVYMRLACTDPPHDGNEHYDETFSQVFDDGEGED